VAGADSFRTSTGISYERAATNASDGSINRYYDPTTGQFLSVDPLRMSRSAWNFGDGPKVLSYAATSFFAV
jgi:hypothetical protein